jgi:error-prone DNA polymerase
MPPASVITPPGFLAEHAAGLIALSGCPRGELAQLVSKSRSAEAISLIKKYLDWFGTDNYYVELQQNLAFGDTARNISLLKLAQETGAKVAAAGNVHYHIRERHRLQDCLVAIKSCRSLEETHRERRPNSGYYLRSMEELETLFRDCPAALKNTLDIAERSAISSPITPPRKVTPLRATWKSSAARRRCGATALSHPP